MTAMFKIEKGVPVPSARSRYPFASMAVGDSFLIAGGGPKEAARANNSAGNFRKKRFGWKFAIRKVEGGIRIWRVA